MAALRQAKWLQEPRRCVERTHGQPDLETTQIRLETLEETLGCVKTTRGCRTHCMRPKTGRSSLLDDGERSAIQGKHGTYLHGVRHGINGSAIR